MRYFYLVVLIIFTAFFLIPNTSFAAEDPLGRPNNKMGVHILFTSELEAAARLINSNGGDWGYVTIPIQVNDKNLKKWQNFMNEAKKLHIIPIIRLATAGDYFTSSNWQKPSEADVLDFANFLKSLNWPVKNKYVIIFNEVNRGDEWEGAPNPQEYARLLNYSVNIFKSLDGDFFIISAGLDNAAANVPNQSMSQYTYMIEMDNEVPGIFGQIDGLGSHSYPNPGFSQPPWIATGKSITSFRYEQALAKSLGKKDLPVFITETGWSTEKLSEDRVASYLNTAFETVWSDESVIAVTPFLLHAGSGPFAQFTLIKENGVFNKQYEALQNLSKVKGEPVLGNNESFMANNPSSNSPLPVKKFPEKKQYEEVTLAQTEGTEVFFKWLLKSLNMI